MQQQGAHLYFPHRNGPSSDFLATFLEMHGLHSVYSSPHIDQGGELWLKPKHMQISMKAGCHLEPSYASSENGNVERLNGTFSSMVRPLFIQCSTVV